MLYFYRMNGIKQKVALNNIRFFSYHGYYPEEQLTGSAFYLDVETEFEVSENPADDLSKTVNYERLFEIASEEMKNTRKLLETAVWNILNRIKDEFEFVDHVRVAVRKVNPPLAGETGSSLVELNFSR